MSVSHTLLYCGGLAADISESLEKVLVSKNLELLFQESLVFVQFNNVQSQKVSTKQKSQVLIKSKSQQFPWKSLGVN